MVNNSNSLRQPNPLYYTCCNCNSPEGWDVGVNRCGTCTTKHGLMEIAEKKAMAKLENHFAPEKKMLLDEIATIKAQKHNAEIKYTQDKFSAEVQHKSDLHKVAAEAEAKVSKMTAEAEAMVSKIKADSTYREEKLARESNIALVVSTSVQAVAPSQALQGHSIRHEDFMLQEEIELLKFVETHASKATDAAVNSAIALCMEFSSSGMSLHNAAAVMEDLIKSSTGGDALQKAKDNRNTAASAHWTAARRFNEACSGSVVKVIEALRSKHLESLQRAREALKALSQREPAVGNSDHALTDKGRETFGRAVVELARSCVAKHGEWMQDKRYNYEAHVEKVKDGMRVLSGGLHECCNVLEAPVFGSVSLSIQDLMTQLWSRVEERAAFLASLVADFASMGASICECAEHVIAALEQESLQLEEVVVCMESAAQVEGRGEAPGDAVLHRMHALWESLSQAEDDCDEAELLLRRKKRKTDKGGEDAALQQVQKARKELRSLQLQQDQVWKEAYTLASCGYPELPSLIVEQCNSLNATGGAPTSFLSLSDPKAWGLLAPQRRLDMYEQRFQISSVSRRESRHDVWKATLEGVDVCLKVFNLGRAAIATEMLKDTARTFQHELLSVARLSHPHVVPAELFFLETDGHSLFAYVQYPYYPCGSLDKWLESLLDRQASHTRIRIVLHDALRGLCREYSDRSSEL